MSFLRYSVILVLIRNFSPPLPYFTSSGGKHRQHFLTIFGVEKLERWAIGRSKSFKIGLAILDTIPTCDGQTDRQTPHDGIDRAMQSVVLVK